MAEGRARAEAARPSGAGRGVVGAPGSAGSPDVAVVGGGPVGAATALAFARRGASVLVLEANPRASGRLAGEWLHPPALAALRELGVELPLDWATGAGFCVFAEDGSAPHVLAYAEGAGGAAIEHARLVDSIRGAARSHPGVRWLDDARVTQVSEGRVSWERRGHPGDSGVHPGLIVGADGRASVVRGALGYPSERLVCSRMAGVLLRGVELPREGFGHVFIGGPGPVLAYRVAPDLVRLCLDVPRAAGPAAASPDGLWDAFAPVLPEPLRAALRTALREERVAWAANQVRPRDGYGERGMALVGDAVGHYHPLTAVGMTLGFRDALELARAPSLASYARRRRRDVRVPELLAVALYEVFTDPSPETLAIRRAVYALWQQVPRERRLTMGYLACEERRPRVFGTSFARALGVAARQLSAEAVETGRYGQAAAVGGAVLGRLGWLIAALANRRPATSWHVERDAALRRALDASSGPEPPVRLEPARPAPSTAEALARGRDALRRLQAPDGSWEGEVVWCPMLAAQLVMTMHLLGRPIDPVRRGRLLVHFERTRLPSGEWGFHPDAEPSLFVTALVYVASRLLGLPADDPRLQPARALFDAGDGVRAIPTWGKFWLALLGLYDWEGLHPVLPEAWALPRRAPLHPRALYCHTRLIYLPMAALYAERPRPAMTTLLLDLRAELYPAGWDRARLPRARSAVRTRDLHARPTRRLRALQAATAVVERLHRPATRRRLVHTLRERIRHEVRTTSHRSISPVSGLLNILALHAADAEDPDVALALERLEDWLWEDDHDGTRLAGAQSGVWDTAFALQALASAGAPPPAIARARAWLAAQQVREPCRGWEWAERLDPRGGWCFAGPWQAWPVSDCTAEAMLALIDTRGPGPVDDATRAALADGVEYILRTRNRDGGFGSYEAARGPLHLDWLNPAEMFGDAMTDHSWVECTGSCIAALAAWRSLAAPDVESAVDRVIDDAARWLRRAQRPDGAWEGAWGVRLIYGTMFGVRGLLAAGARPTDPAIRRACAFLLAQQRPDGGFGELPAPDPSAPYHDAASSHAVQTAWALMTLLDAREPDRASIERAARCLVSLQQPDGQWPPQRMVGVFFQTALLDYTLYRAIFPVQALATYEHHERERLNGARGAAVDSAANADQQPRIEEGAS
jgi:lanosterol synthase